MALAPTARKAAGQARDESSVERLYLDLRDRAMRYQFKPGARINEQVLGRELGVSRGPLREALNRLVAEGMLDFVMNKGFFRKAISVDEVFDLYQVRIALERRAVFLAVQRASDADIAAVMQYWDDVMARAPSLDTGDFVLADEEFHRRLVALARNKELSAFMEVVTRRIHVARHIDIEQQSEWNLQAFDAHRGVVELIARRDTQAALALLTEHIDISLKRAIEITKEMAARFFLVEASSASEYPAAGATHSVHRIKP
ncbi:GntR family transcriptional regulator [Verticiella sediminum]|uniref:GntR family transcriptional regulator n=1 Tax=Verticiella sediminum TaxID=1247510 RepID=A0A556AY92_9BURK|nr:GntR family transcriptional regulator [Verticiella sediminum]TSH97897.1 GntR family transcriptional regulator [Verticiella sediminum]